ncbi:hypothetical protein ACWGIA_41535 [Streptomyces bobili]
MTHESRIEPREFIRRLQQDDLTARIRIVGMVKSQENDADRIFFSHCCVDWIPIPVDMIESIEHLGSAPCKDHSHPLVAIYFGEAISPEVRVFAQLLNSYRSPRSGHQDPPRPPRNGHQDPSFPGPWPCWVCQLLPPEEMLQCLLNCGY